MNLIEERALETALTVARHLNRFAVIGGKPRELAKREQQSSTSLMKATRKLFTDESEDESGEYKAENSPEGKREGSASDSTSEVPPDLVSVSNSSSSTHSSSDLSDSEGSTEALGKNKPDVPKERAAQNAAPKVVPEKSASREKKVTPQPAIRPDPEVPPMPSPGFATDELETPRPKDIISLVTTSESDREATVGAEKTPIKENSIIETPDRSPEIPDTEDRAFIKGSDESSSFGEVHTSDSEYVPTDVSIDGSLSALSLDSEPPPPAPPKESPPEEDAVSREELETARQELEALKAQKAREAQQRIDEEVERRAAELCAKRLAAVKEEMRKKAEPATARAIENLTSASKPATLEEVTQERREKIATAVVKAVEIPLPAAKPPSKKEKRAATRNRDLRVVRLEIYVVTP